MANESGDLCVCLVLLDLTAAFRYGGPTLFRRLVCRKRRVGISACEIDVPLSKKKDACSVRPLSSRLEEVKAQT